MDVLSTVAHIPQDFEYSPLDNDTNSIRIVEVLPELCDGNIQVEMRKVSTPEDYRCLSYMWGEGPEDHAILINNRRLLIRKNLHDFLELARHRLSNEPLWIDALSINQKDHVEKGYQVQRMGKIYEEATEVLIWLGYLPDQDFVFDFFDRLREAPLPKLRSGYLPDELEAWQEHSQGQPERVIAGLRQLCSNPYWWRAWIAQEIILAREALVLCGTRRVKLHLLCQAVDTVRQLAGIKQVQDEALYCSPALELWKHSPRSIPPSQIFEYEWIWKAHCYDARDRIYSVLALLDHKDHTLEVDYTEDLHSFFWRAGEHFQAWNGDLSLHRFRQSIGITASSLARTLGSTAPEHVTVSAKYSNMVQTRNESLPYCINCDSYLDTDALAGDLILCTHDASRCQHIVLHIVRNQLSSISYERGLPIGSHFETAILDLNAIECVAKPTSTLITGASTTAEQYSNYAECRLKLSPEFVIQNLGALEITENLLLASSTSAREALVRQFHESHSPGRVDIWEAYKIDEPVLDFHRIPVADWAAPSEMEKSTQVHSPNPPLTLEALEMLDTSYRMRTGKEAWEFFRRGRVFAMLWTETADNMPRATARAASESERGTVYSFPRGRFGDKVYSKIRRFVVMKVRPHEHLVYACAISSHSGLGTLKQGCNPSEHTIVYLEGTDPSSCYLPGEYKAGMTKEAIQVIPVSEKIEWKSTSRLCLSERYPIEWNVKVKEIGKIHPQHMSKLIRYWQEEMAK